MSLFQRKNSVYVAGIHTMTKLQIRTERDCDVDVICSITERAFRDMPYAGGDEQDVIDRLRSANVLTLSLVAVLNTEVVGHIAFSPAKAGDGSYPWYALGPVSVVPEHQREGIGSALIKDGLAQLRDLDALGCILTGNPLYYQKFGFELAPDNTPRNESEQFFMVKQLSDTVPQGRFAFHGAFYGEA